MYICEGSLVRDKAIDYIGFVEKREDNISGMPTRYRVRWMTNCGFGYFYTYAQDDHLEFYHEFDI